MLREFVTLRVLLLIVFAASGMPNIAATTAHAEGAPLVYIVATKVGGGYDTMGRLIAKYLPRYLEVADVRVKNVPGASHVVGALEIFNAGGEGLTIGTFNTGLIYAQIVGDLPAALDLRRFAWVGKATDEARVLVVGANSPFTSIEDLRAAKRPIVLASSGLRNASHYESLMLARALGLDVKIIPNFAGQEPETSMLRGEIDGTLGSESALAPFVKNGFGRILLRIGGAADASIPQARDLVQTEEGHFLVTLIETQSHLGRLTASSPHTDPRRLEEIRRAYDKVLGDPELLAEAAKLGIRISARSGEDVAAAINASLNLPAAQLERLKTILKPE